MLGVEWQRKDVPGIEGLVISCRQGKRGDLVL